MSIYKLNGKLQHYTWGGKNYLPQFLHLTNHIAQPYAEWWLGTHVNAMSTLDINGETVPLNQFLQQNPTALLSTSLAVKNSGRFSPEKGLPYLLKILDVEKPLSIQLHPTKQQAEQGFLRENTLGIPLEDPARIYKDDNHKPEMMIALSEFWLLHGFQCKEKTLGLFQQRPSLQGLAHQLEHQSLAEFYADIMQADQAQLSHWLLPIIAANKSQYENHQLSLDNPDYWVLYTIEAMDISLDKLDVGLLCFYLFNIVRLEIGEGIYQDAGIPHAYLRGQNIELMACSDNVVRGGLTPKHVDIPALLELTNYQEIIPQIIAAKHSPCEVSTYSTPAQDFALTRLSYQGETEFQLASHSAEILLVMEGKLKLCTNQTALELQQGEAIFITAGSQYELIGFEQGYAVKASLPA